VKEKRKGESGHSLSPPLLALQKDQQTPQLKNKALLAAHPRLHPWCTGGRTPGEVFPLDACIKIPPNKSHSVAKSKLVFKVVLHHYNAENIFLFFLQWTYQNIRNFDTS